MIQFITTYKTISISVKRDDLLHPLISGNKFRKLKYNLLEAKNRNCDTLVTFGGAFSNHILATAAAAAEKKLKAIGIIRGEELAENYATNPTLQKALTLGMQFVFVSREAYRNKGKIIEDLNLNQITSYIIPEGGTNDLAVQGCEEILNENTKKYDYICCSVGTGGTVSGIINASEANQEIIGFSSLKGDFLSDEIRKFVKKSNWSLNTDYHFGGYGKVTDELIQFINDFKFAHHLELDPIYTGKMVYGILELIDAGFFKTNTSLLFIHTGGLQGIAGMNQVLAKQNRKTISI